MTLRKITYLLFVLSIFTIVLFDGLRSANSYSTDAPEVLISIVKNASVPTCNSCHGNGNMGSIPVTGDLTLTKPDGNLYAAGIDYPMTFSVDKARVRHGFQVIALDEQGNSVGTLSDTSDNVQVEVDAVHSVSHVSHHNLPNSNGNTFHFNWKAPTNYQGEITFHMIAVAANGNRSNDGDIVYYDTMKLRYDATVGINDFGKLNTIVYPTLTRSTIWINRESSETLQASIFNREGQKVLETFIYETHGSIDIAGLGSGLYFVHLSNEQGASSIQKILIQQ